jgi:hypothetical protein
VVLPVRDAGNGRQGGLAQLRLAASALGKRCGHGHDMCDPPSLIGAINSLTV